MDVDDELLRSVSAPAPGLGLALVLRPPSPSPGAGGQGKHSPAALPRFASADGLPPRPRGVGSGSGARGRGRPGWHARGGRGGLGRAPGVHEAQTVTTVNANANTTADIDGDEDMQCPPRKRKHDVVEEDHVWELEGLRRNLCPSPVLMCDALEGDRRAKAQAHARALAHALDKGRSGKRQRASAHVFVRTMTGQLRRLEFEQTGNAVKVASILDRLEEELSISREAFRLMLNKDVVDDTLGLHKDVNIGSVLHMVVQVGSSGYDERPLSWY